MRTNGSSHIREININVNQDSGYIREISMGEVIMVNNNNRHKREMSRSSTHGQ